MRRTIQEREDAVYAMGEFLAGQTCPKVRLFRVEGGTTAASTFIVRPFGTPPRPVLMLINIDRDFWETREIVGYHVGLWRDDSAPRVRDDEPEHAAEHGAGQGKH